MEEAPYEDVDGRKASILAGPVFRQDDQVYRGVGLPREYWKVLVYGKVGTLSVRAFLLT